MLTCSRAESRPGVTLVELVVAMMLAGVVLATVAMISLRNQRLFREAGTAVGMSEQLREAAGILPVELRGLTPADGDIREARDTALEIRAAIAGGVGCRVSGGALELAPAIAGVVSYGSSVAPIDSGDTAWVLATADSGPSWRPHRVLHAASVAAHDTACTAPGPRTGRPTADASAWRVTLDDSLAPAAAIGMPVHITRPIRYSIYRAVDGSWYLGLREWNAAAHAFNGIQPVSGPFRPPSSKGAGGLVFTYFDTLGGTLPTPVSSPRSIAAVQIELRAESKTDARVLGAGALGARMLDSVLVVALIHNRD